MYNTWRNGTSSKPHTIFINITSYWYYIHYLRLVVNPITVYSYAFLFNCMTVGRASDSMTALRAEHFLYFNNNKIYGEGLVPVKCIWAPPPPHQWLRLLSALRRWFCCCWFVVYCYSLCGNCSMFCWTLIYGHSSFAIILIGKREQVALLSLSSGVSWLLCGSYSRCVGLSSVCEYPDHIYYFWRKALMRWLVPDACLWLGPQLNLRFYLALTICESWAFSFVSP